MEKIWYVIINEIERGPFTLEELILNKQFTPDTLTRKEGVLIWRPAREIPEFQEIFPGHSEDSAPDIETNESPEVVPIQEELALDFGKKPIDPIYFYLVLLLIFCLMVYLVNGFNK